MINIENYAPQSGRVIKENGSLVNWANLISDNDIINENGLLVRGITGGGGGGVERELIIFAYRVKTAFTGASVGDTVTSIRVIDVATVTPSQVGSVLWTNETTGATLSTAPNMANLEVLTLTNEQLRASALPLPSGAATETTLDAISDKVLTDTQLRASPVIVNLDNGYDPDGEKLVVGTARDKFFDNFFDFDTTSTGNWEIVQTGSGMTVNNPAGGAVAGSSPYIRIASGTTINEKTIIRSRATFRMPLELRYQITASQRIANNQMRIGFLEVDPVTGALITNTTYSTATAVLNARNAVMHTHDGVTATTSNLSVRAAGSALDTFANAFGAGFTTVATGTTPNFISATTYSLALERDKINSRAWGQNVLTNTGGQFSYDRILANPNKSYKLYIVVENGSVAPASNTDWRVHLINVMDATRFDVSPRNPGSLDGAKAFPTWIVGSATIPVSLASIAIVATPVLYADTTTNLGASATFTGTSRDGGATALYQKFVATATAGVAGTFRIEGSADNVTWYKKAETTIAANEAKTIEVPAVVRYFRVVYVNGVDAQTGTVFAIRSSYQRV